MSPVGGRPSRRLRGKDAARFLDVECFCGATYEVPEQLLQRATCPRPGCHIATRDVPEGKPGASEA